MGGRAFQRRGSLLKNECLALLFRTVTCLSFPCAEDLVDPTLNDIYLVMSKLLLGAFNDLMVNIISENSKVYMIGRRFSLSRQL